MKIKRRVKNPYFEYCQQDLSQKEKEWYGFDGDANCGQCSVKERCFKGEYNEVYVPEENLYEMALDKWGIDAQEGMLIEEIGEVLIAFNKRNREVNGCDTEEFIEELADLNIITNQIGKVYEKKFKEIKEKKLQRLADMLTEGSE